MKVAFVSSDWAIPPDGSHPTPGGAGFYRSKLPSFGLKTYGGIDSYCFGNLDHDPKTGELCPVDWYGNISCGWDVIVIQRWMDHTAPELIRRARAYGQVIVNDIDDWFWGLDPANIAFVSSHPKRDPFVNRNHYWKALGAGDMIICSTPYLAERLARLNVPTVVINNALYLPMFTRQEVRDTRVPNIGWVGSTMFRSGDLETLRGILPEFLRRHNLKFFHGGHSMQGLEAARMLGLDAGRTCVRNLCPIDDYPALFEQIDVGLVPLRDTPFNSAKTQIKGLEYAASGIPFIAQALDSYVAFGEGIVCRRPRDWKRALERLLEPDERRKLADSAYERVQAEDISVRWRDWARALSIPVPDPADTLVA